MRQYLEVKDQYPDCIVFFRLGDFYEMFFDDAVVVARALDLTLTSRDKGKENPVPMCGVPHHAAHYYLAKLVALGFKVAICDQVEDPKVARGIVRREVVRVVTPGVVLDEDQLDPKAAHYLVSAVGQKDRVGIAALDVSTGEFTACEISTADLLDELARLEPRELIYRGIDDARVRSRISSAFTALPEDSAQKSALDGIEIDPGLSAELALIAAREVVAYARATQPVGTLPVTKLLPYRQSEHLVLDESSRANLELFRTIIGAEKKGSLLEVIDQTRTSMGGRLLRLWLSAPLTDLGQIRRRLDAVEWLFERASVRTEIEAELAEIYDLERLTGRVTLGVATPRDLSALGRSLKHIPTLKGILDEPLKKSKLAKPALLTGMFADLCEAVAERIGRTLVDDPPAQWKDGNFCRRGFSPELDELLDLSQHGKDRILQIESRERERTGIGSLKIRYNRVFGYYLEITRSNLDRVPTDYVRKQTLANAERFVTPELADYEAKILHAEERRLALEMEAFTTLRAEIAAAAPRLLKLAAEVARLDVLRGLAELAHRESYVRPEVDDSLCIEIEEGRHPVVEKLAARGQFVPNDIALDAESAQLIILTGPNMAGKSTAMRQVALITILGQMGSFVPAKRARIGVADRVFTRVGAADNLARGDSTFMVEMRETANILQHATKRSLVVLDEIGRGTSTYDGLSIAWAVAEHLHDTIGARTLFATHYHELTQLAASRPRIRNFSTAVREHKDEIIFLHRLVPGGASRSYGIQVARLAGIDRAVIDRAKSLLASLERGELVRSEPGPSGSGKAAQLNLLGAMAADVGKTSAMLEPPRPSEIERLISATDLDGMSPREAHAFLFDLKSRIRD